MYHTLAFDSSIALTSTNQSLKAIADSVLRIGSANGYILQEDMMLLAAKASGVGIANTNLQSPKLLQFRPFFITPLDTTLASANPDLTAVYPHRAFTFRAQEEITAFTDNSNAGAQVQALVAHLATKVDPVPPGEILILTGSSTTAAVANAWTQATVTLDQQLPEGVYAMVGSEHQSTNAIAHRFTFLNGQVYRPGNTSTTAFTNRQSYALPWMVLGTMGYFSNVSLFNTEVLCGAADAAHTFRWRCIKVQ
jgi:hypothetical protein